MTGVVPITGAPNDGYESGRLFIYVHFHFNGQWLQMPEVWIVHLQLDPQRLDY